MDAQLVLSGNVGVPEICSRITSALNGADVVARPTHQKDYWLIEVFHQDSSMHVLSVFLNSYAKDDYPELSLESSTFLTLEACPQAQDILAAAAKPSGGWMRPHEGAQWQPT